MEVKNSMFGKKIKVSSELMSSLETVAKLVGCSSVEEYAERVLTAETQKVLNQQTVAEPSRGEVEAITQKLKGLGYLE